MERKDFELLTDILKREDGIPETLQKKFADRFRYDGPADDGAIRAYCREQLKPYEVKRAVFLAAGFGSRMLPITINTPKPLVRVNGKRIIETILDAVLAKGIEEIYIVRGYLGEEFDVLLGKYPMIRFIENPEYENTGTISSFYYARDHLENAYVLESDLVIQNPEVIRKYHYASDFAGSRIDKTDDWYFKADGNDRIYEIGVGGEGNGCYKLIGMSYWNGEDGRKLARHIRKAYEAPDGKKLPMSFVPFRVYRDQYDVLISKCQENDVVEIDSFRELQMYDENYRMNDEINSIGGTK